MRRVRRQSLGCHPSPGDVTEYVPFVVVDGAVYTMLGKVTWTDGNGTLTAGFSVAGAGVHGSRATFAFDAVVGAATNPVAAASPLDLASKLLYIKFDTGAPTSVDEVAVSYDFASEPPPTTRSRELNLSAAHTYWDQFRLAVGFQYRDAVAVTPHDTNYIRLLPNGMPEEFSCSWARAAMSRRRWPPVRPQSSPTSPMARTFASE